MKKTYIASPVLPIFTFLGFAGSLLLLNLFQGHLDGNISGYMTAVIIVGIFCFIGWLGLIIRIDHENKTVTRILFPFIFTTYSLSDVVSVDDMVESDVYGKQKFTEVHFKNGKKWNLLMFSQKDLQDIKDVISQHAE